MYKILITGGAGFIGSAVVRNALNEGHQICNIDKLTYAGNLDSLIGVNDHQNYHFEQQDICNSKEVTQIIDKYKPHKIMHLAAETHVDRSIDQPLTFIETNVFGTFTLLDCATNYWRKLNHAEKSNFIFHHVSTDEVFGDLDNSNDYFLETTPYAPSSPYSASKASADHMVRAWHRTYGLPTIITNCSNNYGPYQFPEKLIPLIIINAISGQPLPVYGSGLQVRDWLFVEDHAKALLVVLNNGEVGETYNIGGHNEKKNIEVVEYICKILDDLIKENKPKQIKNFYELIKFVEDRPGHDKRYAINAKKIKDQLGWVPSESFESGLRKTVKWYLENKKWWERILDGTYQLERIGLRKE